MGLRGSLGFMPTGRVAGVALSACAAKCQFQADMLIVGIMPIADIEANVDKRTALAAQPQRQDRGRMQVFVLRF